jgi:hypothetical protein
VADKVKRGITFNHREITPGKSSVNAISHPQPVKPVVPVTEEPGDEPIIMIDTDPVEDAPHLAIPRPAKPPRKDVVPAALTVMVCKNCNKYPLDHFEVAVFPHMNEGWCSLKCWQACLARKCCG